MGIHGLLPVLKSITDDVQINTYSGITVGIDTLCWLHKGIHACAMQLALGEHTNAHIKFCTDRLDLLLANHIKPLFVFDGASLPSKAATEKNRREHREKAKNEAFALLAAGDKQNAYQAFARAVDVSPELAYGFVKILRTRNIPFIIAPYEADAQLAYLAREKLIDAVISEDSDMIAHNVPRTLFKMQRDGSGKEIRRERISSCKELSLSMFTDDMILWMCILSGCDYLDNLPGMAIKGASEFVRNKRTTENIINGLRFEYKVAMPENYEFLLAKARLTFLHQRVYDPRSQQIVSLTPLPSHLNPADKSLDFLGPWLEPNIATAIATGMIDPSTLQPYKGFITNIQRPLQQQQNTKINNQKTLFPSSTSIGMQKLPGNPKQSTFFTAKSQKIVTDTHTTTGTENESATILNDFMITSGANTKALDQLVVEAIHQLETGISTSANSNEEIKTECKIDEETTNEITKTQNTVENVSVIPFELLQLAFGGLAARRICESRKDIPSIGVVEKDKDLNTSPLYEHTNSVNSVTSVVSDPVVTTVAKNRVFTCTTNDISLSTDSFTNSNNRKLAQFRLSPYESASTENIQVHANGKSTVPISNLHKRTSSTFEKSTTTSTLSRFSYAANNTSASLKRSHIDKTTLCKDMNKKNSLDIIDLVNDGVDDTIDPCISSSPTTSKQNHTNEDIINRQESFMENDDHDGEVSSVESEPMISEIPLTRTTFMDGNDSIQSSSIKSPDVPLKFSNFNYKSNKNKDTLTTSTPSLTNSRQALTTLYDVHSSSAITKQSIANTKTLTSNTINLKHTQFNTETQPTILPTTSKNQFARLFHSSSIQTQQQPTIHTQKK